MKRISIIIAAMSLISILLASCGCKNPINLRESRWYVKAVNGEKLTSPMEPLSLRISYSEGRIGGFSGCNTFGGELDRSAFDAGKIRVENIFSTRMACPGMNVEGVFLNALRSTTSYKLRGNKLYFYGDTDGSKPIMLLEPAPREEK